MIEFEAHYWEHQQHVKVIRKKEAQKLVRMNNCLNFLFCILCIRKICRKKVLLNSYKMRLRGWGLKRRRGWEKCVCHLVTFLVSKILYYMYILDSRNCLIEKTAEVVSIKNFIMGITILHDLIIVWLFVCNGAC